MAGGTGYVWAGGIGSGGQRLWTVPGPNMVVVTTAGDYNQRVIWKQTETLLDEVMIVVQSTPR